MSVIFPAVYEALTIPIDHETYPFRRLPTYLYYCGLSYNFTLSTVTTCTVCLYFNFHIRLYAEYTAIVLLIIFASALGIGLIGLGNVGDVLTMKNAGSFTFLNRC